MKSFTSEHVKPSEINNNFAALVQLPITAIANNPTAYTKKHQQAVIHSEGALSIADSANSTSVAISSVVSVMAPYIDRCNNSSLNLTYWTGTTTGTTCSYGEDTERCYVTGDGGGSTGGGTAKIVSTGINLKSANSEIVFYASASAEGGDVSPQENAVARVSIVGSTSGEAHIINCEDTGGSGGGATAASGLYRCVINVAGTELKYWKNANITSTPDGTVSLAGLVGTSWYLQIYMSNGSNSGNTAKGLVYLYGISRVVHGDSAQDLYVQTTSQTLKNSSTSAAYFIDNTGTSKMSISCDGGSNHTAPVTGDGGIVSGATAGTSAILRAYGTTPTSISTSMFNCPVIRFFGALFA